MAHHVFLLECQAHDAPAAAVLRAESVDIDPFDVAARGDGDDDFGVGDEILDLEFALSLDDLRAPLVAELLLERAHLVFDHGVDTPLAAQEIFEPGDRLEQRHIFIFDLLALERDEALQT